MDYKSDLRDVKFNLFEWLALGKVLAGEREEDICELELELRQGEPAALLELAAELAADLPLTPCDISKAERGYRLFDPASYDIQPDAQKLLAETPLDGAFAALAWALLGSSQRLAGSSPWSTLELDFDVPTENCGAQWLRLELAARIPAETQIGGRAWFDDVAIMPLPDPS
jgi:hypothetical protein